jgi:transposase
VSGFDHTLEPERRLRRIEVINGVSGRRRWSLDEKARILDETFVPGAVVSEVARRHGLSPQQLFGWRRDARRAHEVSAAPAAFVPAVIEAPAPVAAVEPRPGRRRRSSRTSATVGIEIEIAGVVVRVGSGAAPKAIVAVIRALKAGS